MSTLRKIKLFKKKIISIIIFLLLNSNTSFANAETYDCTVAFGYSGVILNYMYGILVQANSQEEAESQAKAEYTSAAQAEGEGISIQQVSCQANYWNNGF